MPYKRTKDGYTVSDDQTLLDFDVIHGFLRKAYWCESVSREVVERAARHALAFGLYENAGAQIGYGRSITDRATFAYLADVFVLEQARGRGLGIFLVEAIMGHPDHRGLKHMTLATRDAHELYAKFGFKPLADPSIYMHQVDLHIYKSGTGSS